MNNLVGQKFGRLVVLRREGSDKHQKSTWFCECECGNTKVVSRQCLKIGKTKSCGCLDKEHREAFVRQNTKHGKTDTVEFYTWKRLFQRCYNKNSEYYYLYGGKGIGVCDRWNPKKGGSFQNFYDDMGLRPKDLTSIERIDSNKNYSPENCRWANYKEQSRNTSQNNKLTINGETKVLSDWVKVSPVTKGTIVHRINKLGWDNHSAVFTSPSNNKGRKPKIIQYKNNPYTIPELCRKYKIPETTFRRWYNRGMSIDEIIKKLT